MRLHCRPPQEFFNLTVSEFFHGRNKSEVTIETCFSWNPPGNENSGMTMIAVDIPSGYEFEWTAAYDVMGHYPGLLVNFDKRPGKTLWYLDYVPTEETCFQVVGIITFMMLLPGHLLGYNMLYTKLCSSIYF